MGWTGKSWLISKFIVQKPIKIFAGSLFVVAGILFFISGIAVLTDAHGLKNLLLLSSIFSTLILLVYWDGQINMLVPKGVIGVLINLIIALIAIFYL